jgi:PAS domain S-box-containing protein
MFELSADMIFTAGFDGRFKQVNPACEKVLGYSREELLAIPFLNLIHPDDKQAFFGTLSRVMKGESVLDAECRCRCKNGSYKWLQINSVGVPAEELIYLVARDITESKRVRETLDKNRQLLDSVLKNSLDGIVAVEAVRDKQGDLMDFRFLLVNPAAERLLGKPAEELVGHGLLYTFPDIVLDGIFEPLTRIVESGESLDFEYSAVRGREMRWFRVAGVKLGDGLVMSYLDVTERKMAEARMERLGREHAAVLNSVTEGVHWIGVDGKIKFENRAAAQFLGYEVSELLGQPAHPTMHHTRAGGDAYPVDECPIYATLRDGLVRRVNDEVFWRKDGTSFPVEYTTTPIRDDEGQLAGAVVVFTDVTDRKRIEDRLFQSQKMETVGKLAGGIAHEFNSILTAIIGQSELLLNDLPSSSPMIKSAIEIRQAANRAATLTRQLLAYGRKQILQPEFLDLNEVVNDLIGTLQHLMNHTVDVCLIPTLGLKLVKIDPGQIEQVIVSLAMNAADAMPNGGRLTLETANVTLDEEYVRSVPGLKAGDYVMLAMTDSGIGMSDEVRAAVFEPFFSTKGVGQGTGLGLATCYGIIRQSEGHITVYSEICRGTTFKIYLPQAELVEQVPLSRLVAPDLPRGTETILLAEDDPSLREMSATLLRRLGYTVLTAVDGIEALSLKQQRDIGHIDLLFTDVVMPHMSGKELSDRIQRIYPQTKILFTSAYTENAIVHHGVLNPGVMLLQKPFTPSALANKIREVLDRPVTPPIPAPSLP